MKVGDVHKLIDVLVYKKRFAGQHTYRPALVYGIPARIHMLKKTARTRQGAETYAKRVIDRCKRMSHVNPQI